MESVINKRPAKIIDQQIIINQQIITDQQIIIDRQIIIDQKIMIDLIIDQEKIGRLKQR